MNDIHDEYCHWITYFVYERAIYKLCCVFGHKLLATNLQLVFSVDHRAVYCCPGVQTLTTHALQNQNSNVTGHVIELLAAWANHLIPELNANIMMNL